MCRISMILAFFYAGKSCAELEYYTHNDVGSLGTGDDFTFLYQVSVKAINDLISNFPGSYGYIFPFLNLSEKKSDLINGITIILL